MWPFRVSEGELSGQAVVYEAKLTERGDLSCMEPLRNYDGIDDEFAAGLLLLD